MPEPTAKNDNLKEVIAIGPAKEAALYFDRVLPFDLAAGFTNEPADSELDLHVPYTDGRVRNDVLDSLIAGTEVGREAYVNMTTAGFAVMMLGKAAKYEDHREVVLSKLPGSLYEQAIKSWGLDFDRTLAEIAAGEANAESIVEQIVTAAISRPVALQR